MKQVNLKKYLLPNLPYVLIALYATKLGQAWRLAPAGTLQPSCWGCWTVFPPLSSLPSPASTPWTSWWDCAAVSPCGWRSTSFQKSY